MSRFSSKSPSLFKKSCQPGFVTRQHPTTWGAPIQLLWKSRDFPTKSIMSHLHHWQSLVLTCLETKRRVQRTKHEGPSSSRWQTSKVQSFVGAFVPIGIVIHRHHHRSYDHARISLKESWSCPRKGSYQLHTFLTMREHQKINLKFVRLNGTKFSRPPIRISPNSIFFISSSKKWNILPWKKQTSCLDNLSDSLKKPNLLLSGVIGVQLHKKTEQILNKKYIQITNHKTLL